MIEISGVSKTFPARGKDAPVLALQDVDLRIEDGEKRGDQYRNRPAIKAEHRQLPLAAADGVFAPIVSGNDPQHDHHQHHLREQKCASPNHGR